MISAPKSKPLDLCRLLVGPVLVVLFVTGAVRDLAFAQTRSAASPIWSGTSGGYVVSWTAEDLVARTIAGSSPVFSVLERWKTELKGAKRCTGGNSLMLQSVVGAIVSYREESAGECEGAAHPWATVKILALDTRRGGIPAKLTDLFPEADLLRALLGDKMVQEALGSGRPGPTPSRLSTLIQRIMGYQSEDCRWAFPSDLLSRFAVHHLEKSRVALRIGLSHGCEVARGSFTQMTLILPIPEAWQESLSRAAQRQEGFLTQDAPKLFGKKRTEWSFAQDEGVADDAPSEPVAPLKTVPWGPSANFAALSSNDRIGLTSKGDGVLRVWDLETGRPGRTFVRSKGWMRAAAVSADGASVAAGTSDGNVVVWDLATGAERFAVKGYRDDVWTVAFSPDGTQLLSGGNDGKVKLWNLATGEEQRVFTGHTDAVRSVVFAGHGLAISASNDHTVRVWDLAEGRQRYLLAGHKEGVWALAVSPTGDQLLSGSEDRTVKVWDLTTGQERMTLLGHVDRIRLVAYAPQGRIAASTDDTTLKLWDLDSGKQIGSIGNFENQIVALRFALDGHAVLTGSETEVKTWPVPKVP
jgi:WD domain, G-beta repeat